MAPRGTDDREGVGSRQTARCRPDPAALRNAMEAVTNGLRRIQQLTESPTPGVPWHPPTVIHAALRHMSL
jgi:hypothetical protein